MSIADEIRTEARQEGFVEGMRRSLRRILDNATPAHRARFESRVQSAHDPEILEQLEAEIMIDIVFR